MCPSLTAHSHLRDQEGEVQGCEQSVCGIMLAACVFVVCLSCLGLGRMSGLTVFGFMELFHLRISVI